MIIPLWRIALPDWAAVAVTGLSVLLALVTLVLVLRRPGATPEPTTTAAPRLDIMLLVSTLAVLALGAVILLVR